jgi:hypothetical protein
MEQESLVGFDEHSAILAKEDVPPELHIPTFDQQIAALDQSRGEFDPCPFVDASQGGSGHLHFLSSLLLGQIGVIQKPDRLIFIQGEDDLAPASVQSSEWSESLYCRSSLHMPADAVASHF